jgi:hypothetical protein
MTVTMMRFDLPVTRQLLGAGGWYS